MTAPGRPIDAYVEERIREALVTDPRVGELGLTVVHRPGGHVVVRGSVSTAARKAAVAAVAAEVLEELGLEPLVVDETRVPGDEPPGGSEVVG